MIYVLDISTSSGEALDSTASETGLLRTGPKTNRQRWSSSEDSKLCELVKINFKNLDSNIGWNEISSYLPGRSEVQCRARWKNHLQPDLVKGPWTKEEDELVIDLVKRHGPRKWAYIAKHLKGSLKNVKGSITSGSGSTSSQEP